MKTLKGMNNLINPVICSLIGDNTNRKTAKNIRKAGFAIK